MNGPEFIVTFFMSRQSSPSRGRGQTDESGSGSVKTDETPLDINWDDFCDWFWIGSNGNDLIKKLNARKKGRPVVYCIVLNDGQFPGKSKDKTKTGATREVQWKLCKVGFTHVDTTKETSNRMEDVMRKIRCSNVKYETKREGRKASVLFKLSIGAVDTTPYLETENRIREAIGWPIDKKLAKEFGLPCSTEWVLTTQAFIYGMIEALKAMKEKGTSDPIDLFKELKYHGPIPPSKWLDEKKKTVVTFADL